MNNTQNNSSLSDLIQKQQERFDEEFTDTTEHGVEVFKHLLQPYQVKSLMLQNAREIVEFYKKWLEEQIKSGKYLSEEIDAFNEVRYKLNNDLLTLK
jgi:hypothetical protein